MQKCWGSRISAWWRGELAWNLQQVWLWSRKCPLNASCSCGRKDCWRHTWKDRGLLQLINLKKKYLRLEAQVFHPSPETVVHTSSNNLFFALRGAGSSYGVATQFRYIIHKTPETLPAILLAWADSPADLEAIKVAAQDSPDYSITISEEFTKSFWQNSQVALIYKFVFPPIMTILRLIGKKFHSSNSYPVFLTVTDIRDGAGRSTRVIPYVQLRHSCLQSCQSSFQSSWLCNQ